MRISTAAAMKAMDAYAIEKLGVPSDVLMENAARHVAAEARRHLSAGGTACIFCGSGNNGGDGVASARFLLEQGYTVSCFLVGRREKMTPDTALMERRLQAAGGEILPFSEDTARQALQAADVAIDAMFGIGLNGALRGDSAVAAALINESGAYVIACDIASGILSDTGEAPGVAVRADCTVTFSQGKPGLYVAPGLEYAGEVFAVDIGVPLAAQDTQPYVAELTDAALVRSLLPKRPREAHKGMFGKLLLLCGSRGFTGAAALCARAALRTGAGLVFLGVPAGVYPILAAKLDEAVVFPLPETADGTLAMAALPEISRRLAQCDACVLGPGLGRSAETDALVCEVLRQSKIPVLLDADGITALAGHIDTVRACPLVVTPHDGEFARLGGGEGPDRIGQSKLLARRLHCTVLRKGHRTVVTDGGACYLNTTGNPGMAVGGSGDVLSGVIAALLGQGAPPVLAAAAGAWLHGAAGDQCARTLGEISLLPSDLIAALPAVLQAL